MSRNSVEEAFKAHQLYSIWMKKHFWRKRLSPTVFNWQLISGNIYCFFVPLHGFLLRNVVVASWPVTEIHVGNLFTLLFFTVMNILSLFSSWQSKTKQKEKNYNQTKPKKPKPTKQKNQPNKQNPVILNSLSKSDLQFLLWKSVCATLDIGHCSGGKYCL